MPTKKAKASKALMTKASINQPKEKLSVTTTKVSASKMPGSNKLKANAPVSSIKMEMVHKSQKVGNVKKSSGMYDFQNIHTGDAKSHPGILKAKADKAKRDAVLASYKNKAKTEVRIFVVFILSLVATVLIFIFINLVNHIRVNIIDNKVQKVSTKIQ